MIGPASSAVDTVTALAVTVTGLLDATKGTRMSQVTCADHLTVLQRLQAGAGYLATAIRTWSDELAGEVRAGGKAAGWAAAAAEDELKAAWVGLNLLNTGTRLSAGGILPSAASNFASVAEAAASAPYGAISDTPPDWTLTRKHAAIAEEFRLALDSMIFVADREGFAVDGRFGEAGFTVEAEFAMHSVHRASEAYRKAKGKVPLEALQLALAAQAPPGRWQA